MSLSLENLRKLTPDEKRHLHSLTKKIHRIEEAVAASKPLSALRELESCLNAQSARIIGHKSILAPDLELLALADRLTESFPVSDNVRRIYRSNAAMLSKKTGQEKR